MASKMIRIIIIICHRHRSLFIIIVIVIVIITITISTDNEIDHSDENGIGGEGGLKIRKDGSIVEQQCNGVSTMQHA